MKRLKRLTRAEKKIKFGKIAVFFRAKKEKQRRKTAKELGNEFKN